MSMVFTRFSYKTHIHILVQIAIPIKNTAIYRQTMPKATKKGVFTQYYLLY